MKCRILKITCKSGGRGRIRTDERTKRADLQSASSATWIPYQIRKESLKLFLETVTITPLSLSVFKSCSHFQILENIDGSFPNKLRGRIGCIASRRRPHLSCFKTIGIRFQLIRSSIDYGK